MLYENSTKDIIDAQNGNEKIMTKLIEDNNGLINSELHDVVCSKKIRSF